MSDIPKCKRPECPRSDTELIKETEAHFTLRCKTCGLYWVISRTKERAKALHQLRQEKINRELRKKARPTYFT